jgi:hypothetical protein
LRRFFYNEYRVAADNHCPCQKPLASAYGSHTTGAPHKSFIHEAGPSHGVAIGWHQIPLLQTNLIARMDPTHNLHPIRAVYRFDPRARWHGNRIFQEQLTLGIDIAAMPPSPKIKRPRHQPRCQKLSCRERADRDGRKHCCQPDPVAS